MAKGEMEWYDWIVIALIIVGAINWGLIGFFNWNLVDYLFGAGSVLSKIIYDIVGLAAIFSIFRLFRR